LPTSRLADIGRTGGTRTPDGSPHPTVRMVVQKVDETGQEQIARRRAKAGAAIDRMMFSDSVPHATVNDRRYARTAISRKRPPHRFGVPSI